MISPERWFWCERCDCPSIRCNFCKNISCSGGGCGECQEEFEEAIRLVNEGRGPKKEGLEVTNKKDGIDRLLRGEV